MTTQPFRWDWTIPRWTWSGLVPGREDEMANENECTFGRCQNRVGQTLMARAKHEGRPPICRGCRGAEQLLRAVQIDAFQAEQRASKLTTMLLEELSTYFRGDDLRSDIVAQSYAPHGGSYDPSTDTRLERLLTQASSPVVRRVAAVMATLAPATIHVLRLAVHAPTDGFPAVAARLPAAIAHGRAMAEAEAREAMLGGVLAVARARGDSPMACAVRVLEADADPLRPVHVSPRAVQLATEAIVRHGLLDVREEAEAVVDHAVDAYLAASRALKEEHRAVVQRRDQEREALRLAARERRAAREREWFERKLRGAA